jgi:hypothetical protein
MTTTQLISDAAKWPRIAASRQQHADIQKWLLANGVDPYDVLAGGTVAIEDLEAPPPAAGDDATAAAQAAPALSTGQDTSPVTPPEES